MFELFVVGPVATSGLGLIRRCIECQTVRGTNAPACSGVGDGCLAAARPGPGPSEARAALDSHQT